jgi:hypothetical protein
MGKGCTRVNIVETLCIHVCKWKNETCCNYSRNGGRGTKENDGGSEFNYDIRTFVNVTMYPQYNNNKKMHKPKNYEENKLWERVTRIGIFL